MRDRRHVSLAAAFTLAATLLCSPVEAGVRAFVASTGNDANTASQCGPTTPCRSFTAAMSIVDPNGEIIALDAAGYGAVTVTKSAANPGVYAGVAASAGNAITIDTPGVNVALRGLYINNVGGAVNGIYMTRGTSLSVENCLISNFSAGTGIGVVGTTNSNTPIFTRIVDTVVRNSQFGMQLQDGARAVITGSKFLGLQNGGGVTLLGNQTGTTSADISESVVTLYNTAVSAYALVANATVMVWLNRVTVANNGAGVAADLVSGSVTVTVSNSTVTGSTNTGLSNGAATFRSLGNNVVRDNGTDTTGTITVVSGT